MELNGTIFLQIFIFLTLLFWLSGSLFAPIMRLFDERERRIAGAEEKALEFNELALKTASLFDQEYEQARENARHALNELKQSLEKEHAHYLSRIKIAQKEQLEKSQASLLEQEKEARKELMKASSRLSDDIVAVFLRKTVQ